MERGIRNLSAHSWEVDFVITHCAPLSIGSLRGYTDRNRITQYLDEIREKTAFRNWFFGHHHENLQLLGKYLMLYEQIIRIQ